MSPQISLSSLAKYVLRTQCLFPGNFPSNFMPFPQSPFQRPGAGYCRPFLLEEGVSELWGPSLPCSTLFRDAPPIDVDEPEKVLDWIQDRITCHIPDEQGSPELHRLVTRYQLHKCNKYCKRHKKIGKTAFITRCKFGFPRPVCETVQLNPVQESLKCCKIIYQLVRTGAEVRVNDCIMLMLWKANIDIQFVA